MIAAALDTAEQLRIKARGTELERRLLEALSGENWGASSSLLNQIAQDTHDFEKYPVVMKQIWAAMENTGANWRKVFKGLTLVEHLIKNGNERVVEDSRDRMRQIRVLIDFNYFEGAIDRGSGVREKARNVVELLQDNQRIREEREKARQLREKFSGSMGGAISSSGNSVGSSGNSGFGGYPNGSYSSGGIGSSSFEQKRQVDSVDHRQSRYSDMDASVGSGSASEVSESSGRYSDEAAPPIQPKKEKAKRIDIKIKPTGSDKPVKQGEAPSAIEPDLLGVPDAQERSFFAPTESIVHEEFGSFSSNRSTTTAAAPSPSPGFANFSLESSSPAPVATGFPMSSPALMNTGFPMSSPAPMNAGFPMSSPAQMNAGFPMSSPAPMNAGFPMSSPSPMNAGFPMSSPAPMNAGFPMSSPVPMNAGFPMSSPSSMTYPQQQIGGVSSSMGVPPHNIPIQPMNPPMQMGWPMNQGVASMPPAQPYGIGGQQQLMSPPKTSSAQDGFGEFQHVPNAISSSLVDLGGLSLNDKKKSTDAVDDKSQKNKNHSSFQGLDGFNMTPAPQGFRPGNAPMQQQGFTSLGQPLNSSGYNPQMQPFQAPSGFPHVMGQAPMGYGAPVSGVPAHTSGQPMMSSPNFGQPSNQPMGYPQQQQWAPF